MSQTLGELLYAMRAVEPGGDQHPLVDAIEAQIADDPVGSRVVILGYTGDELMRIWALGLLADPDDFDLLSAAVTDPGLRFTALEALSGQPDRQRAGGIARTFLDDPDPRIRDFAARMVAFCARL